MRNVLSSSSTALSLVMGTFITALISRISQQAGTRGGRAGTTRSGSPARPGGRRWAAASAAWPAAGTVLALLAASAPAAYAATGTAPGAPQALCVFNGMPYSGSTWMQQIAPCIEYRKLSEIAIPGSHDSATYAFTFFEGAGYATTQDEDITHQLDDGMRSLDIRVDYHDGDAGPNWYVVHGPIHSSSVTLGNLYAQILGWAEQPGRGQEIIKLNLSITGGDDKKDCSSFGYFGNALVTPQDLVDHFGTTNPGELTLGQLWSLPNSYGIARVIMSNIPCLQEATGQTLPEWAPSGGYYADQCSAEGLDQGGPQEDGIINRVLPAAANRYTGAGGIPQAWGPPSPAGNLYELDVQGTPETDPLACAVTPLSLLPDEKEVIQALFNSDGSDNLNYVVGDFVEQTELLAAAVSTNTWPRFPAPPSLYAPSNGDPGQIGVSFQPPEYYGTAPITSYTVTATYKYDPRVKVAVSGDSSPIIVTGLTNGYTYDITVTANNPYGASPPSAPRTIAVGVPPYFASLPAANGIVGKPYSSGFVLTGTPPITVSLYPGKGNLPPGLTLNPDDGALTGTPTKAGSYTFEAIFKNLVSTSGVYVTITISAGVNAKIAGCSPRAGNNAWGCTLDVTLPPLAVDTVFSVGIGGGGFTNPSGGDRPQAIAFQGCQVAPLPSPYYPGNGGYNRYDVNISTGGCTDGAVVVLEEAVTAAAGATITQSVTVPGLPTSTDTFVLPPPGEPGSASPSPSWSRPHRPRLPCRGSQSSAARIAITGESCRN